MRLVAITRVEQGAVLARDVLTGHPGQVPLLRAGVRLTKRYCEALREAGVHAVYVDDELSCDIEVERALSDRTRDQASHALEKALGEMPALLAHRNTMSTGVLAELSEVVRLIAADLAAAHDAVLAFSDLATADAYTLQHSVDVCALGLLLADRYFSLHGRKHYKGGRRYDKLEEHLTKLGVGLMLHDIGKLAIPAAVLNKPGPLDVTEWALMRRHPEIGLELLPGDLIGPLAKTVVRNHHERFDGEGYPDRLAGDEISEFARIAAVADTFDAVTSERPYRSASPPHMGVRIVRSGAGSAFDPKVVEVFNRVVAPYPPGHEIELADGRRGVVMEVRWPDPDRPLVRVAYDRQGRRVDPVEVDLRERPELSPSSVAEPGREDAA